MVVYQKPVQKPQIMSATEGRVKLQVLMNEMEKAAKRHGETCIGWRYQKRLEDLFKACPPRSLDQTFKHRLLEYAETHDFWQAAKLWIYGIGLTYNGKHLDSEGKVDLAIEDRTLEGHSAGSGGKGARSPACP